LWYVYALLSIFLYSIVMEYADNGDLYEKILDMQKREVMFSEDQIWKLFI